MKATKSKTTKQVKARQLIDREVPLGTCQVYLSSNGDGHDLQWYDEDQGMQFRWTRRANLNMYPPIFGKKDPDFKEIPCVAPLSSKADTKAVYHPFRGVGTSLDGAACRHLQNMTPQQRREHITMMLDPINGAGLTQFRLVIGTCDFNTEIGDLYSYYDTIPDGEPIWNTSSANSDLGFSIMNDVNRGIVDIILEVLSIAEELGVKDQIRFLSSPWSPPGWMKENVPQEGITNNELNLIGGNISDAHLSNYAIYLRRYLEDYAVMGINIHALTLQNEPVQGNSTYPNCLMTGQQQATVARLLKEQIANSSVLQLRGVNTEIWAWDFLPDDITILPSVVDFIAAIEEVDPGLTQFDGIAFHHYFATPYYINTLSERFPHLTMHITEAMEPGTFGATRVIQCLRDTCVSFHNWVTVLDTDRQPNEWGNSSFPGQWNFWTLSVYNGEWYWFFPHLWLLGQIGKFVRPGCIMRYSSRAWYLSFENIFYEDLENHNMICIIDNNSDYTRNFTIGNRWTSNHFEVFIPPKTMGTYIYSVNNNITGDIVPEEEETVKK